MEKIQWNKFLQNKHILRLGIILFTGILLLCLGGSPQKEKGKSENTPVPDGQPYAETERRLERILSEIQGVGDVSVMITYDGTGKREYLTDVSRTQQREEVKSNTSENYTAVLPKDSPVIEKEVYPKVRGVVAVCEGAGSTSVHEQVFMAIKAALDVEEHRIGVFAK